MLRFAGFSIKEGDQIYKIQVKIAEKIYDNYVVCDPKVNRIIWDNIFNEGIAKKNIKLYD